MSTAFQLGRRAARAKFAAGPRVNVPTVNDDVRRAFRTNDAARATSSMADPPRQGAVTVQRPPFKTHVTDSTGFAVWPTTRTPAPPAPSVFV